MKTDPQLKQDVLAELKWEPMVDAVLTGAEARDGVVNQQAEVAIFSLSHTAGPKAVIVH